MNLNTHINSPNVSIRHNRLSIKGCPRGTIRSFTNIVRINKTSDDDGNSQHYCSEKLEDVSSRQDFDAVRTGRLGGDAHQRNTP